MDKTTPEDVNFYREAAREKHDKMVSANTAKNVFTILYAVWWGWSMVDTYTNYPYKTGNEQYSFHIGLQKYEEGLQPTIQFSYQF